VSWTRRRVLQTCGLLGAVPAAGAARSVFGRAAPVASSAAIVAGSKHVALYNLHTGEKLTLEFYRGDDYLADSMTAIQTLLRDYRNGEQHPIDPKLMDYLFDVARILNVEPVFSVISGYRSPQTNEHLRERGDGVARHSLHLEGRAIDVRLSGVSCADLAAQARDMTRGGVGYYQKSDFVHLDTGRYRTWNG
jgi:uncharacterized protein YcbK (DUF882 family)